MLSKIRPNKLYKPYNLLNNVISPALGERTFTQANKPEELVYG